jgi:ribosomal protein S4
MTRNDSLLYTGASLASTRTREVQDKRKEATKAKEDKRTILRPYETILREQINKEIHDLIYAPYVNEEQMTDEQFRIERRSRKLAVTSLIAVQSRLDNIMRTRGTTE